MKNNFIILTIKRNIRRKIFIDDILYCQADNNYTEIHLTNNTKYEVSKPLKEIEEIFDEEWFCRISRKYLINIENAIEIDTSDSPNILLVNNKRLEISKTKLAEVEKKFYKL